MDSLIVTSQDSTLLAFLSHIPQEEERKLMQDLKQNQQQKFYSIAHNNTTTLIDMFIPEEEYREILKVMPVFCVDFLIRCKGEFLLIKRTQEPVKGVYWVIGGRMRYQETMENLAIRVQTREVGQYLGLGKTIGFSNYFFPDVEGARATHTPTLLQLVDINEKFDPQLDDTSADFVWSDKLPSELDKQTRWVCQW